MQTHAEAKPPLLRYVSETTNHASFAKITPAHFDGILTNHEIRYTQLHSNLPSNNPHDAQWRHCLTTLRYYDTTQEDRQAMLELGNSRRDDLTDPKFGIRINPDDHTSINGIRHACLQGPLVHKVSVTTSPGDIIGFPNGFNPAKGCLLVTHTFGHPDNDSPCTSRQFVTARIHHPTA